MDAEKKYLVDNISDLMKLIEMSKEKIKESKKRFESITETLKKWNTDMAKNEKELKKYEKIASELTEGLKHI